MIYAARYSIDYKTYVVTTRHDADLLRVMSPVNIPTNQNLPYREINTYHLKIFP